MQHLRRYVLAALIGGGLALLAGCQADSTTAPARRFVPSGPARDLTCKSGYTIATRSDGTQYCAPDGTTGTTGTTVTSPTSTSPDTSKTAQ